MRPISKIKCGQVYIKPSTRTEYVVLEISEKERMVKVTMLPLRMDGHDLLLEKSLWVRSSSPIFIHDPVVDV